MINLDGPPLCDECGRRLAPHTDGMECGYCGWGTRLVVRSARDQAPHHSAEIERLRAEVAAAEAERDNAHLDAIDLRDEGHTLRAEVASLRAQPRVHPMAWRYLTSGLNSDYDAWADAGGPLLATDDDATTPTVGASVEKS